MSLKLTDFLQKALSIYELIEDDGILVVGIIGKDSAEWKKSDIANDATQSFVFNGQSDEEEPEIFIEAYFIAEELTLYLILHGIHDVDYQFKLFASEDGKNKSFFEKLAHAEYQEINLLHVVFLLSHLVFFVEQGRYFDTHWLKTLSQVNRLRMNNMNAIIKRLQTKEGIPQDWLEYGRLAAPRCCFLFSDKILRYDLHINKKKEITEKLEQCWANQIFDNMKLVKLMGDNMTTCIGHLPDIPNIRPVFICKSPKEEPRDILADLVLRLADHRPVHSGGVDDEPDPDCGAFIRSHIHNAFNYGDDDPYFFCFPTLKEFVIGAEVILEAAMKKPANRDDLAELIPELELVQSIESSHFEKAFQTYRKALMAKGYFTEQEHQTELNKIIASLPVTGEALAELVDALSTACHDLWWKDHQRCEAVSVTGHNCKHGDHEYTHMPHNSGYRFTSSCNCGRKQMTRNDPFTLKEANFDFYKQGFTCCMNENFYLKFPIFVPEDVPESMDDKTPQRNSDEQKTPERGRKHSSPSIQDTSALSGDTNTEVDDEEVEDCFDRYLDDDKLKQMFLDEEETERRERTQDMDEYPERSEEVMSPIEEDEPAGSYLETYDSQITGLNKGKSPSITYENLLKQYKGQFLEYLPHSNAPPGLLPGFPSWSVFCVGQSNRYSHVAGLRSPNFKHGSDYLLPLDVFITVNNDEWEEDMKSISKNDFKPAPRKATKSPVDDDLRREKLRFFIGFDYECPRGHRFIIEKPGKVLQMDKKQGFQAYKEEAANLLRSDIPIWTPCTCKRSPSVSAQLMRLHVVLPKAPIVAKLDLKVQASSVQQTDGYFYPSAEPIKLAQNRYYVIRFPFAYESPEGPIWPPRSAKTCGKLLKNWMTVDHIRISKMKFDID